MKTTAKTYFLVLLIFAFCNTVFAVDATNKNIKVVYFSGKHKEFNQNNFENFNLYDVSIKQIEVENININTHFRYLNINKEAPRIYVYSNNKLIAQTGYAINHKLLSVEDNFFSIDLSKIKNKEHIKIVFPRHRYKLFYSTFYFSNVPKTVTNNNDLVLFNIGFHLALCFFAIFWLVFLNIKQNNLNKFYISLLLVTSLSIINFMLRSNFIEIDNINSCYVTNYRIYNVIGCLDPLLYYFLYYYYFNLKSNKLIRCLLYFNLFFWVGLALIENTTFSNYSASKACIVYLNCAAIVDFVSLLLFAIIVLRYKWKDINDKIVFLGLLMMVISAYEMAQIRILNIFNLSYSWVRLQGFSEKLFLCSTSINLTALIVGTIFAVRKIYQNNRLLNIEVQKQKENLNKAVLETQSRLLSNLSKDLHDDLGQKLSVINFSLENLRLKNHSDEIKELKEMTVEISNSIRDLSHWLSEFKFENKTLYQIIQQDIKRLNKVLPVTINLQDQDSSMLSISEKIILFRIYQELMNNSLKHSNPTTIEIEVSNTHFQFSDNGSNDKNTNADGIGLKNIYDRIDVIKWKYQKIDLENFSKPIIFKKI